MATRVETQQCYPKPIMLGDMMLGPAPEPAHERCPGGLTRKGVLGGWVCPCPCHHPDYNVCGVLLGQQKGPGPGLFISCPNKRPCPDHPLLNDGTPE